MALVASIKRWAEKYPKDDYSSREVLALIALLEQAGAALAGAKCECLTGSDVGVPSNATVYECHRCAALAALRAAGVDCGGGK